ncbi:MAG: septum formation initiator family protein [Candidatus Eremiobacteraeota bacterium]|nr:septum formation initiator family protein [Candidatus Eremiobacteraeota bacterium]
MNTQNTPQDRPIQKEEDSSRAKRLRGVFLFLIFSGLAFFAAYAFNLCYVQKKMEYELKLSQIQQVEQENERLQRENRELKKRIAYLNTKDGVESIAREKLGFIKPQEIAFVVISSPTPHPSKAPLTPAATDEENIRLKKEIKREYAKEEGWFGKVWNSIVKR